VKTLPHQNDDTESSTNRQADGYVDIWDWALRVATWDGLLPACVLAVPILIDQLCPQNRVLIDLVGGGLPIVAFLVRLLVGTWHICLNRCSELVSAIQTCLLWVAVFLFVFVDTMLILSHQVKGVFASRDDCVAMAVVVSIYLPCMIIAMYPGRKKLRGNPLSE
jgi:hypothetical protein